MCARSAARARAAACLRVGEGQRLLPLRRCWPGGWAAFCAKKTQLNQSRRLRYNDAGRRFLLSGPIRRAARAAGADAETARKGAAMKLEWIGHACFRLTAENGTVIVTRPL